ncbi:MAG: metallophosphoesterase family protein [Asticcacaulis sp.]
MRRRSFFPLYAACFLAAVCPSFALAQDNVPVLAAATAQPERIILNLTADPQHEMAISWRSAAGAPQGKVQFAVSQSGPEFTKALTEVPALSEALSLDVQEQTGFQATYNSVVLSGLTPSTRYVYRVGDGTLWSEWLQFSTAADKSGDFSFVYMGDAQNDVKSHASRVWREALRTAPEAAFWIHAGDLINRATSDREWGEWFEAGGFIHSETPSLATPGNHEYSRGPVLSPQWRPQYTLPENGPEGRDKLKETAYYVDYQGLRIISVDAPLMHGDVEERAAQIVWLEELLKNNPNRWTVIFTHFPLYSTAPGRDNIHMRDSLKPLIDKYGVDLVLQGHDHGYARGSDHEATDAAVYVVSVGGPKMYAVGDIDWADRKASYTQLFQVIDVANDSLTYKAYTADGQLYDQFELRKNARGKKRMIEQVPSVPELWSPGKRP